MRLRRITTMCTAAAALLTPLAVATPTHAAPPIQPGVSITMGGSYCTLNWIYDGTGPRAGTVYGGTAAHCVESVGQRISLSETSLGPAIEEFGTVAYISADLDTAFIEVDAGKLGQVNAAMKGHPAIPAGVASAEETAVGDVCQFSGYGVGFHLIPPTQESRVGVLVSNDGTQHYCNGPVSPGDSGGPVGDVTVGNKALGIVNTLGVGIQDGLPIAGEGGVSMPALLADAAANGFPVQLRTVS
jgi:hypothetical protein